MNHICPLCEHNKNTNLRKYTKIGFVDYGCSIVSCNSCYHYFSILEKKILADKLYSKGAYKLLNTKHTLIDKILKLENKLILNQLSKLIYSGKSLLDFGCGKGQFLFSALREGWRAQGIETEENRAGFGRTKYGLQIDPNQYETGALEGGPFDVITLFHVLEHLENPKKLLNELCINNLRDDGCLVVEVPLFNSLQSILAGKNWIHLDPPLHISHFTKRSLVNLIKELDFVPIKFEHFSIHVGILGMTQSIMSIFGYKKMFIAELKFNRTKVLILLVLLVLPFSFCLEMLSVLFRRGGVIRVYSKKITHKTRTTL